MRGRILLILVVLVISGCTTSQTIQNGKGVEISRFDVTAQIGEDGYVIEMGKQVGFDLELQNYHNEDISVEVEIIDSIEGSSLDYKQSDLTLEAADYEEVDSQNVEGRFIVIPKEKTISYSRVFPDLAGIGDYVLSDSFKARVISNNMRTIALGQACVVDMTLSEEQRRRISSCGNEPLVFRGGNNEFAPISVNGYKTIGSSGDGKNTRVVFDITVQNMGGGIINNLEQSLDSIGVYFNGVQLRCNKDPHQVSFSGFEALGNSRTFKCWGDFDVQRQKSYNAQFSIEVEYDYVVERISNPPVFDIIRKREW